MLSQHEINRIAEAAADRISDNIAAKIAESVINRTACKCPLDQEELGVLKSMIRLYKTAETGVFKVFLLMVFAVSALLAWLKVRE